MTFNLLQLAMHLQVIYYYVLYTYIPTHIIIMVIEEW